MSNKEEIELKTKEESNEKEITRDEMVKEMLLELSTSYPKNTFTNQNLNDIKYDLIEIIVNDIIAFRQIIDMSFTLEENKTRIKKSYERNLRAFEKLSKSYKDKYNQEIAYMDQAEVTSVRTIKDTE